MVSHRLMQRRSHLPGPYGSEHEKYPEEDPRQLQPQSTRHLHERLPHRLAEPFAAFLQSLFRLSDLRRRPRSLLSQPNSRGLRFARVRTRRGGRSRTGGVFCLCPCRRIWRSSCIHGRHQRLSCRTGPDTKCTAKSDRIHTPKCSRSHHTAKAFRIKPVSSNVIESCCIQLPSRIVVPGTRLSGPKRKGVNA
jgi:hypothetical protein